MPDNHEHDCMQMRCPASIELEPRVTGFWPRRGLRSGGGTVTVTGEHFGLAGTKVSLSLSLRVSQSVSLLVSLSVSLSLSLHLSLSFSLSPSLST